MTTHRSIANRALRRFLLWLLLSGIIFHNSCEESLPTYVDPSDLLALTDISAEVSGVQRSSLNIHIKGVNNYDDALYDTAGVNGSLHVLIPENGYWKVDLPIQNANITDATEYDGIVLTIAPNDTFHLHIIWNLVIGDTLDILPDFPISHINEKTGVKYLEPAIVKYWAEFSLYDQAGYLEFDTREYEFKGFYSDTLGVLPEDPLGIPVE